MAEFTFPSEACGGRSGPYIARFDFGAAFPNLEHPVCRRAAPKLPIRPAGLIRRSGGSVDFCLYLSSGSVDTDCVREPPNHRRFPIAAAAAASVLWPALPSGRGINFALEPSSDGDSAARILNAKNHTGPAAQGSGQVARPASPGASVRGGDAFIPRLDPRRLGVAGPEFRTWSRPTRAGQNLLPGSQAPRARAWVNCFRALGGGRRTAPIWSAKHVSQAP